jgi:hypothetical protein
MTSSGNGADEVWKECIKNKQPLESDDDFHVVYQQQSDEWPVDPSYSRWSIHNNPGSTSCFYRFVRQI